VEQSNVKVCQRKKEKIIAAWLDYKGGREGGKKWESRLRPVLSCCNLMGRNVAIYST
jgi:hypothetical protein